MIKQYASLKYRMSLTIFVLEAIMLALLLWWLSLQSENTLHEQQRAFADTLLTVLIDDALDSLNSNPSGLQTHLDTLLANTQIARVLVINTNDRIIAAHNATIGEQWPLRERTGTHWRTQTLMQKGRTVGRIAIEISTQQWQDAHQNTQTTGFIIAIVCMLIIAMVGVRFGHHLTQRLAKLAIAAQRFADGGAQLDTELTGDDEMTQMGEVFDQMTQKISKNITLLQNHEAMLDQARVELEARAASRTEDLQRLLHEREKTQKALRHREEQYRMLVENSPFCIHEFDQEGCMTAMNPAGRKMMGLNELSEIKGIPYIKLIPDDGQRIDNHIVRAFVHAFRGKISEFEFLNGRKSFHTTLVPIVNNNGHVLKVMGITQDISKQKKAENVLHKARQASENANQAKSLFLANMTHEIRTPLNAILGYAQILRRTNLDKAQKAGVETIERSGNHLLSLINDILDLSKIEAGEMILRKEDFDVYELLQDISAIIAVRCQQKGLAWRVENGLLETVAVHADQGKLRQVLINLLGNAVKFTERGEVVLSIQHQTQDTYRFAVIDTGIGIPKARQASIFQPFYQEEVGMKRGGTGLGLSISKQQIDLMGGRLLLETEQDQGSTFFFSINLPPAHGQIQPSAQHASETAHLKTPYAVHALIVDDVWENRDVLCQMLQSSGVSIAQAEHGREALQKIQQRRPDIIFMDICMPVMDGVQTLQHITTQYAQEHIKCVAFTASSFTHNRAYFLRIGFDEFVAKPYHFSEIYATITQLLDVEFEYTQDPTQTPTTRLDLANTQLSHTFHEQLCNAAELGQITELANILDNMKAQDEDATLVEYLAGLLAQANTDAVLTALQRIQPSQA